MANTRRVPDQNEIRRRMENDGIEAVRAVSALLHPTPRQSEELSAMQKIIALFFLCLLVAACSAPPAPFAAQAPPAAGDVLSVEAQRIIDRASATAQIMATQN